MNQARTPRVVLLGFALALGFTWPLTLTGCGGGDDGDLVVPEVSPEEKAKASMDYYMENQLNQPPQR